MKLSRIVLLALGTALWSSAQPDFTPPTPFFREVMRNHTAAAKALLERGADPNAGNLAGFAPVFFPVLYQNVDLLKAMVAKGADLKAKDRLGSTVLMWAAFDEAGRTDALAELLRLGMDPNAKNSLGETALTWALRRGDTPIVRMLRTAGASNADGIKAAVESALAVLQRSGPSFVTVSGCVSCHHQSLPQMALGVANAHGIAGNEAMAQQQVKAVIAQFKPLRDEMLQETEKLPDPELSVSYSLVGLAGASYAPDATTAAMAHLVASRQRSDGSFRALPARPPLESSDFTATALSLRAIQVYGAPKAEQIQRAAEWLRFAAPAGTEDRAMQLLGMHWGNASPKLLRTAARALLAEQRSDGGWAQLPGLETDAYATGQALVALRRTGMVETADPTYQRGIDFLVRNQMPDGSWLVRTRSFPVQPYKESGFPHGKNQWISAAGTSWAAMALSLSLPATEEKAQRSINW